MDDIAKQLFTLELAVPRFYASILKLTSEKIAPLSFTLDIYLVFGCWLVSLIFIIVALLPKNYKVNINDHTDIRDSFYTIAKYKFNWIIISIAAFSAGLIFVLKDLMP